LTGIDGHEGLERMVNRFWNTQKVIKKRQGFRQRPKAWVQTRFTKAWEARVEHEIWHPEQKSQRLPDGRFELVVAFADE
jgi:hypothetical protein